MRSPPQVKASKNGQRHTDDTADDNERFYIPYASLRNWFKDTSITVEVLRKPDAERR